jgi:hypothetical protein
MANDMTLAFGAAGVTARDCRPTPVCDPRPVCPACGGLECLCRPRFFAGQLLTEEDLNRLDYYIVAKNRLHNRHLFGTGVVCGLEVVCSTCNPAGNSAVIVRPGYALSPCGNDIVVCRDEVVDICDLINRCRPRRDDCVEPGHSGPAPSDEHDPRGQEEWVLAICYQEKPSRGVTALRGSSCSCGGGGSCGCGGGHGHGSHGSGAGTGEASCGCGGGSTKPARTQVAAKAGPRPPQCEPTLTCEGYTFAVYKAPLAERDRQVDPGVLIKRFICCLVPLFEQLTKLPSGQVTPKQMYDWLMNLIDVVRDFLTEEGLYDCDAVTKLAAIVVPVPSGTLPQYMHAWSAAFVQVLEVIAAVFQKCLCGALLPPCPGPELNDCVPIATVTVTRDRCAVHHICNIGNRKFLVTWPSVQYWLSWLPLFSSWIPGGTTLRKLIDAICCTPVKGRFAAVTAGEIKVTPAAHPGVTVTHGATGPLAAPAFGGGEAVVAAGGRHPFTQLLAEAIIGGDRVDAAALLLAGLGATKKDGTPLASDLDLQYPGQAMLVHQVVAPAVAPLVPLLSALSSGAAETSSLEREIDSLKSTVEKQQAAIEALQRR